ncbi:hypothetical protein L228DRAFT_45113 [Xylona heveae TC161]|uniref:Zn(2)-C6 fungal-type domain-containing protein n=1 Tax=Xylona heveae (strain CBS 132557 / TC161) TaxID=1328760 RepID=A0A164ZTW6_XYLHT|nr:hypothetical protein L228DRAFT_45113 [Xylona heveae TC161]KZF19511.1 hypothetical protein L228DRAFT_45113 [Xylona heveae TC161]
MTMSSPSMAQLPSPLAKSPARSVAPRKRRRRAPPSGAADDCFTCIKQRRQCDRRRPYCTQCLGHGDGNCSGYKTQLTWGVGVASRGKLRGMSLPIARKGPTSTSAPKEKSSAVGSVNSTSRPKPIRPTSAPYEEPSPRDHSASTNSRYEESNALRAYDFIPVHPTSSPTASISAIPHGTVTWHETIPEQQHQHQPARSMMSSYGESAHGPDWAPQHPYAHPAHPLHRLQTSLGGSYDDVQSCTSATSLSGFSDSEYPSPVDYPDTPEDISLMNAPLPPSYAEFYAPQALGMSASERSFYPGRAPTSSCSVPYDGMASSISSDRSIYDYTEPGRFAPHPIGSSYSTDGILVEEELRGNPREARDSRNSTGYGCGPSTNRDGSSHVLTDDGVSVSTASVLPSSPAGSSTEVPSHPFLEASSAAQRIQSLIGFYDRAICPRLVAFDGPANPYRVHILRLAMESETLRYAIAALSANNLRMRMSKDRAKIRQHHLASSGGSNRRGRSVSVEPTQEPSLRSAADSLLQEESHFKATSVQLLNGQLKDSELAKSDSILATLVILCLFHTCDTGVSQLRTQFAGVRKLLELCDSRSQSDFRSWVEFFFTWFDVMTAAVNDREPQLRQGYLDMLSALDEQPGGLAQMIGCDGRLFRIICRLGRLNLLSQRRPVAGPSENMSDSSQSLYRGHTPQSPAASRQLPAGRDYYSLNYDSLDGSGWTMMSRSFHEGFDDSSSGTDDRHVFWQEWQDVRDGLKEWELDPTMPAQMCSATPDVSPRQRDLLNISESFRYAALLYTERLAHPASPSSHPNFQNLVAQALYHITSIASTSTVHKFLLWPLFITGGECIDEVHRSIVRQRCLDIQSESGFSNNISGLEVLEKVWRDDVGDDALLGTRGRNDATAGVSSYPAAAPTSHVRHAAVGGQAFKWRRAMDRLDGEYIVI